MKPNGFCACWAVACWCFAKLLSTDYCLQPVLASRYSCTAVGPAVHGSTKHTLHTENAVSFHLNCRRSDTYAPHKYMTLTALSTSARMGMKYAVSAIALHIQALTDSWSCSPYSTTAMSTTSTDSQTYREDLKSRSIRPTHLLCLPLFAQMLALQRRATSRVRGVSLISLRSMDGGRVS
jgi:hypothetical protein